MNNSVKKMSNSTDSDDIAAHEWAEFITHLLLTEPRWATNTYTIMMSCIFVVGVIGNLLTCIVIYSDKTMHTATNFYLFNLAVSDLAVTLAILLNLYETVHDTDGTERLFYSFGDVACKIHFFLVLALWNNGILILTALAVERYFAICYPLTFKSVPVCRRVMKVMLCIWVVAIAETLPEIWTVAFMKTKKSSVCFTIPSKFAKYLSGVLAVLTFLIPFGIMVFVYSMIAFKIHVTQKNSVRHKIFNHRDSRSKVNKLIVALTLSFMICWLPFFTARMLIFALDVKQLIAFDQWWNFLYKITGINNWFSAVLNPLLFSLMSTKFRKALRKLWNRKVPVSRSEMIMATAV